jgi:RimJ/RimL family protein N-acetyltransferase
MQELNATDFPELRRVHSGSWLGRAHQGRGLGKEMRATVLHLAFDALGAEEAHTDAWHDNLASAGVSTALGYRANGERRLLRRGRADRMLAYRMARADWGAAAPG